MVNTAPVAGCPPHSHLDKVGSGRFQASSGGYFVMVEGLLQVCVRGEFDDLKEEETFELKLHECVAELRRKHPQLYLFRKNFLEATRVCFGGPGS